MFAGSLSVTPVHFFDQVQNNNRTSPINRTRNDAMSCKTHSLTSEDGDGYLCISPY